MPNMTAPPPPRRKRRRPKNGLPKIAAWLTVVRSAWARRSDGPCVWSPMLRKRAPSEKLRVVPTTTAATSTRTNQSWPRTTATRVGGAGDERDRVRRPHHPAWVGVVARRAGGDGGEQERGVDEDHRQRRELGRVAPAQQHPGQDELELTEHGRREAVGTDERRGSSWDAEWGGPHRRRDLLQRPSASRRRSSACVGATEDEPCVAGRLERRAVDDGEPRRQQARGDLAALLSRARRETAPPRAASRSARACPRRRRARRPGRRRGRGRRRRASPAARSAPRPPRPAPAARRGGSPTRAPGRSRRAGAPARRRRRRAVAAARGSCRGCGSTTTSSASGKADASAEPCQMQPS